MKFFQSLPALCLLVVCFFGTSSRADPKPIWVTGYYPAFNQDGGLTPDKIDFSAITHLVHFSIVPNADGTIADTAQGNLNTVTPAQSAQSCRGDPQSRGTKC